MSFFTKKELTYISIVSFIITLGIIAAGAYFSKNVTLELPDVSLIDERVASKDAIKVCKLHETAHVEALLLASSVMPDTDIKVKAAYKQKDGECFYRTVMEQTTSETEGQEKTGRALTEYHMNHALMDDEVVKEADKAELDPEITSVILSWKSQGKDWSLCDTNADGKWDVVVPEELQYAEDTEGKVYICGNETAVGIQMVEGSINLSDAEKIYISATQP